MKKYLIYVCVFSFISIGLSSKSVLRLFIPQQQNHKEIYLYLGNIGPKSDSIIQRYDIKNIFLIGGNAIDPENNGNVNKLSLQRDILRLIPDSNTTGIAILDWEGKSMEKLNSLAISTLEFDSVIDIGKKILQISKTLRPKIKWGIYALPFRNYWSRNEEWKNRSLALISLLKDCDVITPSVYKLYPDSLQKSNNVEYLQDNISLSLQIGELINKPVLPFVTHRLPNSKLIPKDDFLNDIDIIFNTKYLEKKVTGIIWWGPDEYYYRTKDKVLRNEVKNDEAFPSYFDNLIYKYLNSIIRLNSFWTK